jgi:hypothetical protein
VPYNVGSGRAAPPQAWVKAPFYQKCAPVVRNTVRRGYPLPGNQLSSDWEAF